MRNELAAIPNVKSIEYVSPDDAIKQLSKEEQANIAVLGYNPLPPAFYMKLADPDQVDEAKAAALQIPEVRNCGDKNPESCVTYGEQITKRVLFAVKVILIGVGSVMLLLGIAAVVLIAEHDPALDLLPPPRDRGDEAGRGDQLVRPRAVHPRGHADRDPGRPGRRARPGGRLHGAEADQQRA